MTQAEKAKAYDKAIETCKRVFNFNNLSYTHCEIKEKLEQMFPELSESEDERIRKEIISFIEYEEACGSMPDGWRQAKRPGKWVAFLEKQKENQKSAESILSYCVSDAKWANRIITNAIAALANHVDYNLSEPLKYKQEIDDLKKLREEIEKP